MSACILLGSNHQYPELDETGSIFLTLGEAQSRGLAVESHFAGDLLSLDTPILWAPSEEALGELTIRKLRHWPENLEPAYSFAYEISFRVTPERIQRLFQYLTSNTSPEQAFTLWHLWLGDEAAFHCDTVHRSEFTLELLGTHLDPNHPNFTWNRCITVNNS